MFQVNDRVKVVRESKTCTEFNYITNKLIGRVGRVVGAYSQTHSGVVFNDGTGTWCIPTDMLELEDSIDSSSENITCGNFVHDLEQLCLKHNVALTTEPIEDCPFAQLVVWPESGIAIPLGQACRIRLRGK